MNIVSKPGGRYTYLYSESEGGKKGTAYMSLLKYHFEKRGIGAGKQYIIQDGANTNVNQNFFKWVHGISSNFNTKRFFTSCIVILYHRGHNYNECDNIGNQKNIYYGNTNLIRNTEERVDLLNKQNVSVKATHVHSDIFVEFPKEFDDIYLPLNKWFDENNVKLCIRDDKPLAIEFQCSEIWENGKWKVVNHPNTIYIRQSTDFKVKPRIVKIVKDEICKGNYDFNKVKYEKSSKPKVKKNKIDGTLKLLKLAKDDEMIKYFAKMTNIDNTEQLVKPNRATSVDRYTTQMKRIKILNSNAENNKNDPIPAFKRNVQSGNKRARKKTDKNKNNGNINVSGSDEENTDDDVDEPNAKRRRKCANKATKNNSNDQSEVEKQADEKIVQCKIKKMPKKSAASLTKKQLVEFLRRHSEKVSGNKPELQKRWIKHVNDKHVKVNK